MLQRRWGREKLKSESGARPFNHKRAFLLGLCDRELELVGHDHGSENNVFQSKKEKEKKISFKKKFHPDLSSRLSSRFKKGVVTLLLCVAQDEILDKFFSFI